MGPEDGALDALGISHPGIETRMEERATAHPEPPETQQNGEIERQTVSSCHTKLGPLINSTAIFKMWYVGAVHR